MQTVDARKVFAVIALIMSSRGDGVKVQLKDVKATAAA